MISEPLTVAAVTAPANTPTKMHCRTCGGEILSDSRRVQCGHCGALFPFACLICARSLRTPFPIFEDERYLTFGSVTPEGGTIEAKPLCQDHFLRHCPDCSTWFHAHENAGYFRCASCAEEKRKKRVAAEFLSESVVSEILAGDDEDLGDAGWDSAGGEYGETGEIVGTIGARRFDANALALVGAGGAMVGLVCWYLLTQL